MMPTAALSDADKRPVGGRQPPCPMPTAALSDACKRQHTRVHPVRLVQYPKPASQVPSHPRVEHLKGDPPALQHFAKKKVIGPCGLEDHETPPLRSDPVRHRLTAGLLVHGRAAANHL